MNTDLHALAREFPDMCITVKLADLLEANAQLVRDVRAEVQRHDERLLSAAEVAELLGVTRVTLHRWEKSGYLVPQRVGGMVRYMAADVERIKNDRHD